MEKAYGNENFKKMMVGKLQKKQHNMSYRGRWENNIKMEPRGVKYEALDSIRGKIPVVWAKFKY
jgi:hypothetical protein